MKKLADSNLNMNNSFYITNLNNLPNYTSTYNNYGINQYDVDNKIAINNGNYTPTSGILTYI
jgi:hypothetical protein